MSNMTTCQDVIRAAQARRRKLPRFAAAYKEEAKQRLSERQKWNAWCNGDIHTQPRSRKAYSKRAFDDMVARGIISDWAWACGERNFIFPMTKPALTEDQLVCVLSRFFHWDERQPVEAGPVKQKRSDFMS